jgi:hypothetical protein
VGKHVEQGKLREHKIHVDLRQLSSPTLDQTTTFHLVSRIERYGTIERKRTNLESKQDGVRL